MALSLLSGNTEFNREDHITMINVNVTSCDENGIVYGETPEWYPLGEDNDEITRETNNEIESKKNVLGRMNINATSGPQTSEIDPIAIRGNDKLSAILYMMFKYNLNGDKAKLECLEVTLADKQTSGNTEVYGAFKESAVVDLKSWGGDTTRLNAPITLNWKNDRVHGTYNLTTNTFTPITTE